MNVENNKTNKCIKNGGFNMLKKIRKQLKNEKGLTLVELLAVIVILGIIAAIAIPAIGNIITNSKYNAVKADAINVLNAAQVYYMDNPEGEKNTNSEAGEDTTTEVSVEGLVEAKYLDNLGKIPAKAKVGIGTPHAITIDTGIEFAKGKTVTFKEATITAINEDPKKGSQVESTHEIGG